jgi:hypothetical protein
MSTAFNFFIATKQVRSNEQTPKRKSKNLHKRDEFPREKVIARKNKKEQKQQGVNYQRKGDFYFCNLEVMLN